MITTIEFWKAAFWRALRTFLQVVLGAGAAGQIFTQIDWKYVLASAATAAFFSLLTSVIAGLPEVQLEKTLYDKMNFAEPDEGEDEDGTTF